eukprot:COSAG06_NODE_571_length_14101_cov_12.481682_8_plen_186_part_00
MRRQRAGGSVRRTAIDDAAHALAVRLACAATHGTQLRFSASEHRHRAERAALLRGDLRHLSTVPHSAHLCPCSACGQRRVAGSRQQAAGSSSTGRRDCKAYRTSSLGTRSRTSTCRERTTAQAAVYPSSTAAKRVWRRRLPGCDSFLVFYKTSDFRGNSDSVIESTGYFRAQRSAEALITERSDH